MADDDSNETEHRHRLWWVCAAWSLCSAKRLFHLRPQIDLVLSAAKSALGPSRLSGRLIEITAIEG
jgi:hypothetical protein